jgi:hypothetical protein
VGTASAPSTVSVGGAISRRELTIYEHNFGFWEIDGQVEQAFFEYVQRQSVQKTCDRCERRVRLMPAKTLCASCASALECGAPRTMSRYRHAGPKTGAGP